MGALAFVVGSLIAVLVPAAPAVATSAGSIAAGFDHTCALTPTNGSVKCWGDNAEGQLGDGTTTRRTTPVAVSGLKSRVDAIVAGGMFTCALSSGSVRCWGRSISNGAATDLLKPAVMPGLASGIADVKAGGTHACALTTAGGVLCWGANSLGQLGDGTTVGRSTPAPVSGLTSGVVSISSGAQHSCALLATGEVRCWGYNAYGEIGDGTTVNATTPTTVSGLPPSVSSVIAGGYHTCVLSGGTPWCWGQDVYGQLGDGALVDRGTPAPVTGLSGVTALTGGTYHTCAISGGAASCWGVNNTVQLGDGTSVNRSLPVAVVGLGSGVTGISGGRGHTCAVTTSGRAWCWGWGLSGQIGDGSLANRPVPVLVSGYAR